MDRMALGRMRLGAFSMYSYFRCRVGGGRIQAFRAGQIISLHSWLADGGPEKCSPEHFTSKFKAKFIGWIYMAATKTPIKL